MFHNLNILLNLYINIFAYNQQQNSELVNQLYKEASLFFSLNFVFDRSLITNLIPKTHRLSQWWNGQ